MEIDRNKEKGNIDFSQRVKGKKCEECSRDHTQVDYVPHSFAKHYCDEHWPHSKNDWRHDALKKAWLKNQEDMSKINPEYKSLTPYEQYCFTVDNC